MRQRMKGIAKPQIQTRVDPKIYAELKEISRVMDITLGELTRNIIQESLEGGIWSQHF